MTAYGAVLSLKNTIHHILHSSRIWLVFPSPGIIQTAYEELQPLQEILQILDSTSKRKSRKKVNALDGLIKETLWRFEDLLESLLSDQIHSKLESPPPDCLASTTETHSNRRRKTTTTTGRRKLKSRKRRPLLYDESKDVLLFIDLQPLKDEVHSFVHALNVMKEEYSYELDNMPEDEDENKAVSSSRSAGFGKKKSKMIGLADQFEEMKKSLKGGYKKKNIYGLFGMAGVGKTTLAKKIYEDPELSSHFECRAWIKVGRTPQLHKFSRSIRAQLHGITRGLYRRKKDDYLDERLEDKKCLVVLDDIWEAEVTDHLLSILPKISNGIMHILVTARDHSVLQKAYGIRYGYPYKMVRRLNKEESKELLCHKVFGENMICPHQLDKAATKIAKKCEGLPLTIVTVAHLMSKAHNNDPEYWEDVAEERNSVFKDAYDEISKVLFPTYDYLPQRFKIFFQYMGVFPRDYEIPPSKIINMLAAEGWFLDSDIDTQSLEGSVCHCLLRLCEDHDLVLLNQKRLIGRTFKSCRLHSSWRHLCRGEAQKNKFYHVLNSLVDASEETIKGQRCLCLENNLLFGLTEFSNSVRLHSASSYTRSLLFFGPYHQYPTPIDTIGFKLLRELDALQLRFYTFPTEILKLIQLKYIALTCNGQLPPTISKLFNLKTLIIHPHTSIIKCYDTTSSSSSSSSSYIPIEIWDMKELEHIEILGKSLLTPPNHFASLDKLSTLVGVNPASISTISELSRRIPRIQKLGVEVELKLPNHDNGDLMSLFPNISTLTNLETLKCNILNPTMKHARSSLSSLIFPQGLGKLHLSGMGLPWKCMEVIGSLPLLSVLKLRCYAFRGPKWDAKGGSFVCLKFLLIEDSDLVEWYPRHGSFPELEYLSMKHCYKLEKIYWPSKYPKGNIELVDCSPLAVSCAEKLKPRVKRNSLDITASSSFYQQPTIVSFKHESDWS